MYDRVQDSGLSKTQTLCPAKGFAASLAVGVGDMVCGFPFGRRFAPGHRQAAAGLGWDYRDDLPPPWSAGGISLSHVVRFTVRCHRRLDFADRFTVPRQRVDPATAAGPAPFPPQSLAPCFEDT